MALLVRPPAHDHPDAEALIREARQLRRRRWIISLSVALAAMLLTGGLYVATNSSTRTPPKLVTAASANQPFVNKKAFRDEGNLAFVSRTTLWVLNGPSGSVREVAKSDASDPQFSPNGKWLAYSLHNNQLWLAHADGSGARAVASGGVGSWLPNGELYTGTSLWAVTGHGSLSRVGPAPAGLTAWSPDGSEYAFLTDTLKIDPPAVSHGVERLEVASSLGRKQTLWYEAPLSFEGKYGLHGNFIDSVTVLPDDEGLLVATDPNEADDADGLGLYEIRSPGAPLRQVAVMLAGANISPGANGNFVIGGGGNRYAWADKSVELCNAVTESCRSISTSAGIISLDPEWSPNHETLAFVEAATAPQGDIGQPVIDRWYGTHKLALLRPGSSTPVVVAGTSGAATPIWSKDGKSLLYVSGDGLWLVRAIGSKPVEIATPLFGPGAWPSYYGEVDWTNQFAWSTP